MSWTSWSNFAIPSATLRRVMARKHSSSDRMAEIGLSLQDVVHCRPISTEELGQRQPHPLKDGKETVDERWRRTEPGGVVDKTGRPATL